MPIIAKGTTYDRTLPTAGLHLAVCVDVIDLGDEVTPFKDEKTGENKIQHKCRVVWELDEKHPDFEGPHRVGQKYTLSLNKQANLRKDLERWRGRAFTDAELEGFDLEKLIGVSAQLNIVHTDDGEWANVDTVLPAPKGKKLEPSGHYTRVQDKEVEMDTSTTEPEYGDNFAAERDADELPF